jgi:orotate phosphoribosyltransferase-like protein
MTPEVLTKIFELRKVGLTQRQIAAEINFSRTTVEDVLAGKRWA